MKERISATVEKEVLKLIDKLLENKKYRNKSHVIETAIYMLVKEEKNAK